jgi:transposase
MSLLKGRKITQEMASKQLKISVRQVRRVYKRYETYGALGLISRKRGQTSNNRLPMDWREKIVEVLKNDYIGFGPTFATEKLKEKQGIKIEPVPFRKRTVNIGILY